MEGVSTQRISTETGRDAPIAHFGHERSIDQRYPGCLRGVLGLLPLHCCFQDRSEYFHAVRPNINLIDHVHFLLSKHPEAIATPALDGFPIHYACSVDAPLDVRTLIEQDPNATETLLTSKVKVTIRNLHERHVMPPLHQLSQFSNDPAKFINLMEACPQAKDQKYEGMGKLPLDTYAERAKLRLSLMREFSAATIATTENYERIATILMPEDPSLLKFSTVETMCERFGCGVWIAWLKKFCYKAHRIPPSFVERHPLQCLVKYCFPYFASHAYYHSDWTDVFRFFLRTWRNELDPSYGLTATTTASATTFEGGRSTATATTTTTTTAHHDREEQENAAEGPSRKRPRITNEELLPRQKPSPILVASASPLHVALDHLTRWADPTLKLIYLLLQEEPRAIFPMRPSSCSFVVNHDDPEHQSETSSSSQLASLHLASIVKLTEFHYPPRDCQASWYAQCQVDLLYRLLRVDPTLMDCDGRK